MIPPIRAENNDNQKVEQLLIKTDQEKDYSADKMESKDNIIAEKSNQISIWYCRCSKFIYLGANEFSSLNNDSLANSNIVRVYAVDNKGYLNKQQPTQDTLLHDTKPNGAGEVEVYCFNTGCSFFLPNQSWNIFRIQTQNRKLVVLFL